MTDFSASTSVVFATTSEQPVSWEAGSSRTMHLFLLEPEVIFEARVNAPTELSYPLDEVPYDTVTTGAFGDIEVGMTVLFGSTAGADDMGRQRIRSAADASKIYIGRSSFGYFDGEVGADDDTFITVLKDYRVWKKVPYIQVTEEDPFFVVYKDSNIAYTDQNEESPPVANCGAGCAGTAVGGSLQVAFDATNSFATADGATITSYAWDLDGGGLVLGGATDPIITAGFNPGFYWVALTVLDSNGKTHTTRCPVFVRDASADVCVQSFEISDHSITPSGQTMSFRIRSAIAENDFPDGTLVLLWIGEPAEPEDRSHMMFIGWHQEDPAEINSSRTATLKEVTLDCVDVAGRLKSLPGWGQALEADDTPEDWVHMKDPNMDKYLHYILHWHSTALELADWSWTGTGDTYDFKVLESPTNSSIYEQVARRANSLVPPYILTCDTLGRLRTLPDPMLQNPADRTSTVQATISSNLWSDVSYQTIRHPRIHWLKAGAIKTGQSEILTLWSTAPGDTPGQGVGEHTENEQLAESQQSLNDVTGHRYARRNSKWSTFRIQMIGSSLNGIEPAMMEWVQFSIPAAQAAQRNLAFVNARGLVNQIDLRYSHEREGLTRSITVTWERETIGFEAETVEVEEAEEVEPSDSWVPPTIEVDPGFNNGLEGGGTLAFVTSEGFIWTTSNFTASPPTWSRDTAAATAAGFSSFGDLHSFVVDPFSPGYVGLGTEIRGYVAEEDLTGIWRLNDIFGTPSYDLLYTFADEANTSQTEWRQIGASFGRFFEDQADNPWLLCISVYGPAAVSPGIRAVHSLDAGATWSSEVSVNSAFVAPTQTFTEWRVPGFHMSARVPGLAYVFAYTVSSPPEAALFKTTDWGATWSQVTDIGSEPGANLGAGLHVPWQSNDSERLAYYAHFEEVSNAYYYRTKRAVGNTVDDISPVDNGKTFGPVRSWFGIRSLDTDRRHMVIAGIADGLDDIPPGLGTPTAVAGVFVSDDYGSTWTIKQGPLPTGVNNNFAYQVAFASGNPDIIYLWGNDGYIAYSTDGGDTIVDKQPLTPIAPTLEVIGICGGPL